MNIENPLETNFSLFDSYDVIWKETNNDDKTGKPVNNDCETTAIPDKSCNYDDGKTINCVAVNVDDVESLLNKECTLNLFFFMKLAIDFVTLDKLSTLCPNSIQFHYIIDIKERNRRLSLVHQTSNNPVARKE